MMQSQGRRWEFDPGYDDRSRLESKWEAREATTSMVCWGRLQGLHDPTAGVSARTTPSQHHIAIRKSLLRGP